MKKEWSDKKTLRKAIQLGRELNGTVDAEMKAPYDENVIGMSFRITDIKDFPGANNQYTVLVTKNRQVVIDDGGMNNSYMAPFKRREDMLREFNNNMYSIEQEKLAKEKTRYANLRKTIEDIGLDPVADFHFE